MREKKGSDNGLSVSGSVNQPLIAVGSNGGPSTSSEWVALVDDRGQGDAEENGAGVLFFQVTVDDSGRGAPNSAVTNARCVELCDWWDKCVTYEYFKWDGGRPCGDNSPGGCDHEGAYMRCELWIYPTDASVYSADEEHVDDVWCGAAGNGPHDDDGGQAPQNWPDLDDPTLKLTQPWPPVALPTIPVPICTKSLDYVLIFEWKAGNPYENYADTDEHKADFIAFVENWVHHIDHGSGPDQARGGVIMMNAPSTADCDTGCDTTASSDLSTCACIEWVSRFPQTSGAQIMGDLAAWVASHDPPSGGRHTDIINALDAAASVLDDANGEAIGLSKSIVFALSSYSDTYSETNAKVNAVAARTTSTGEEWNVYFLSVGGVLPSGTGHGGVTNWGDLSAATFTYPGWSADGFSGTSPDYNGHEIMQGWVEHSCPTPPRVYALVAPHTRCDIPPISGFTSYEWPSPRQSYLSCCSDTDNWSGAASGQTFAQLRANCEAACSSGVHGQCNMITYFPGGASCNLGYYADDVRTALVDSVLNGECADATNDDMSVWVLAPADAYRLVGADTKCGQDIHTLATWPNTNNFHPCCEAHDGGSVDDPASQSFEQLKANCEAACDGWAATNGRGSCNVITYQAPAAGQGRTHCELGHYDGGTEAFEQRIMDGDCESNARYDTYVRNTPTERLVPTACFIDIEHQDFPCTGCIDGETEEHIPHNGFGCGTGGNDPPSGHLVDVYFPAADISRVVVHNRKSADCYGTHCSYRLGNDGWEVWYLPTSKGEGAYVEDVAHWVKCFETDVSTENELVLEVDCVASNVFGVRIVQKYWDSMNLNEVEVYGTAARSYKWVLGQTGDICDNVCAAHGLSCSSADQTLLTSCELMLDAMRQAGETCTCETTPGYEHKDYAGSPYVKDGDKCIHFTPTSSATSSCTANLYGHHQPLCHCYSTGDNCVLSGAAHPVTGHNCDPAPSAASASTADAFCKDTGHGGCPGAWCMGSSSGKCGQ